MSHHWGELPTLPDTESGIAALEREQITKPRPMEVEGPPLHQPSSQHFPPTNEPHPAEHFSLDGITAHTIKLIQYSRKVGSMIQSVKQQVESMKSSEGEAPSFPPAPPIPDFQGSQPKHYHHSALPFIPKDTESNFARGFGKAPPEIDSRTCRRLVRRSVAAICAHAGYENCGESILEMLTDVCHEYFLKMTHLLRKSVDDEALNGSTGFPDVMVQMFHEMGIGHPHVLHEFYQTRVINYHSNMIQSCENLRDEYERVRSPEFKATDDSKPSMRVKEEALSDIQFPALEDTEEGTDSDNALHLEGLGLDISMVQDSSGNLNAEDEGSSASGGTSSAGKWQNTMVPVKESADGKVAIDTYEKDDHNTSDIASTPVAGSEAGDSFQDPNSVSVSDIMSPPSIGIRTSSKPPAKKKKLV